MERINLRAYGKINIGLDITGKREDGYHLLKTVMQTVNIYDEITVSKRKKGIMLNIDTPFLPGDDRNLAFKAAKSISTRYPQVKGVLIEIKKKIPIGGGMAGGSTDAAGVIMAIDRLFSLNMSWEEKDEIAVSIGADVPFCLRRGTWLAEGIGEKLTQLKAFPDMDVVICAPALSVSTPWAYQTYDTQEKQYHPDIDQLVEGIAQGNVEMIRHGMGKSLSSVVEGKYSQIGAARRFLEDAGAEKALMSGSGATVFGLFETREKAERACQELKNKMADTEVYLTKLIKGD